MLGCVPMCWFDVAAIYSSSRQSMPNPRESRDDVKNEMLHIRDEVSGKGAACFL